MGAAPRRAVIRENSDPGDMASFFWGGRGRVTVSAVLSSSKVHTEASLKSAALRCRKVMLRQNARSSVCFRREEVSHIIKKCNDFGAGGVSGIAIGELATD